MITLNRRRAMPSTLVDILKRMGCIMWFPLDEENGLNDVIGGKVIRNIESPGVAWYAAYNAYYYNHGAKATPVADIDVDWTEDTFPNGWTTIAQAKKYPSTNYLGTTNAFTIKSTKDKYFCPCFNSAGNASTSIWLDNDWHMATTINSGSGRHVMCGKMDWIADSTAYEAPYPIDKIYVAAYNDGFTNKRCFIRNVMVFNRQLTKDEVCNIYDLTMGYAKTPSGIEFIEKIYNHGSGVVQTDYKPTPNTIILAKCAITVLPTSAANKFLCASVHSENGTITSRYDLQFNYNKQVVNTGQAKATYALDTEYIIQAWFDSTKSYIRLNSGANISGNKTNNQNCVDPMGIFGSNTTVDPTSASIFVGWARGLEVYESGLLVRCYLPAKRNGVVGLYEVVHGVFMPPTIGTLYETA